MARMNSLALSLVFLVLVAPSVVFGCKLPHPTAWTKQLENGRFELSVTFKKTDRPYMVEDVRLSLREVKTGEILWTQPYSHFVYENAVLISPSGRHIAVVHSFENELSFYSSRGPGRVIWRMREHLTSDEAKRLASNTFCGSNWATQREFDGEVFTLVVHVGEPLPNGEYPPGVLLHIDPDKKTLIRKSPSSAP